MRIFTLQIRGGVTRKIRELRRFAEMPLSQIDVYFDFLGIRSAGDGWLRCTICRRRQRG